VKTDLDCGSRNAELKIQIRHQKTGVKQMTQWKCSNCGYTFGAETTPDRCPSCEKACTFSDVTCYIPDCGGPGKIDPRLVGKKDKPINE
jgi:rubredoxin